MEITYLADVDGFSGLGSNSLAVMVGIKDKSPTPIEWLELVLESWLKGTVPIGNPDI